MAAQISSGTAETAACGTFNSSEIEFMAEDELVTIVPKFSLDRISLLAGQFGPFAPMMPVEVPLWLAVALRQRNSCTIQLPQWLQPEALSRKHEQVQAGQNDKFFNSMPFHYQEIAAILLRSGGDFPNAQDIRVKLKDIEDIREAKLQAGLRDINGDQPAVKLNNVSAMEINAIRPFLTQTMGLFGMLKNAENEATSASALPAASDSAPFDL